MPDLRSETAPQRVDRKAGVLSGFVDGGIFTGMAADELNRPTHVRVGRGEERGGHAFGDAFGRKQLLAVLYFLARQLRIQQAGGFETDLLEGEVNAGKSGGRSLTLSNVVFTAQHRDIVWDMQAGFAQYSQKTAAGLIVCAENRSRQISVAEPGRRKATFTALS